MEFFSKSPSLMKIHKNLEKKFKKGIAIKSKIFYNRNIV